MSTVIQGTEEPSSLLSVSNIICMHRTAGLKLNKNLLLFWPQLVLNTDEIKYGGQGLIKDDQYSRKTISKRLVLTCLTPRLPFQYFLFSVYYLCVRVLEFNSGYFLWFCPLCCSDILVLQRRWPPKLLRSAYAQ